MSDIRFNQWLHQSGTGGITQVDGGHVGIGTTNPDVAVHSGNTKKINVGIVTANSIYAGSLYGDGSNLTGISGVTINNNADNRLITGSGSANTLNGESGLTFDNTNLLLNGKILKFANVSSTPSSSGNVHIYGHDTKLKMCGGSGIQFEEGGFTRWHITSGALHPHGTTYNNLGNSSNRVGNAYIQTSVDLVDNAELRIGSSDDLKLYHNGSQSYVANSTGNLNLTSAGAVVTKVNTSEDAVVCNANGSVDLYHNNSKKVETTSTGLKMESSSNQNIHLLKTSVQDTLIQNTGQTEICAATGGASGQRIVFRIGANTGSMPEIARFTPDGLCFGSDTAAVNALDDYEEGSFTPTFDTSISSGTIGSITYSMQAGHYTKIGDLVYVEGVLRANVTNNGTGTWDIAGLPFTCSNASGTAAKLSCKDQASWVRAPDHFSVIGNDTRARARQGLNFGAGQYTNGQSDMFNAGSTSNNRVYFTGCYKAA